MFYKQRDFWPVILGRSQKSDQFIQILLRRGKECALVADSVPFLWQLSKRLTFISLKEFQPEWVLDTLHRLCEGYEHAMPCLIAAGTEYQSIIDKLTESLGHDYLLFHSIDDFLKEYEPKEGGQFANA